MGASLSLSISVTNTSDTAATVKVTLKVKSTSGSWNAGSQYGYITIDGTKYEFHHSFSANTTTTLATKSKSIARTTANKSVAIKGYYKTGVSPGNISKSSSTTVSARPKYNVTFNANNGTNGKTVAVFSGYTTTFPTTTRTGYTFKNWNTNSGGTGTAYNANANTPAITSARTYYAQWTENTAVLSYNANGYGTAPANVTMRYTTQTTAAEAEDLGSVSGSGYHFTNWNTNIDGTGTTYAARAIVKAANVVPSNTTLYAQWALNTYIVNFNLGEGENQGATIPYNTTTKIHGETIKVPIPEWSGHIFAGWVLNYETANEQNIGSEECSLNGSEDGDQIILTAEWSDAARPILLHYYRSATDINNTTQIYKIINKNITVDSLAIPSINNYVFKGWYTDAEYEDEDQFTRFDYNNDLTKPSSDTTIVQNKTYYTKNTITETWDKVENPDSSVNPSTSGYYELNYEGAANNPLHLYAKWNEEYTIIYNINNPSYEDGIEAQMLSGAVTSKKFENGIPDTIGNTALFYAYGTGQCTVGHGWSISEGINNVKTYDDGAQLTISNQPAGYVLNLYAVWKPTTYHVYLEPGNEASGNTIDISKQYYESYLLPSETSSEWHWTPAQNHHLSNWLLNTTNIPLATTITVIGDITYKAAWVDSYHVPVIPAQTGIIAKRYVDANYTGMNEGGKYIQISAEGTHGSYDGRTVSTHTYSVDVAFYDTNEIDEATPVATYNLDLTSTTETFFQVWGKPLSQSDPTARPLYDKKLNMLYCVLQIIDTTDYGESIAEAKRTFTYSFEIPLKRAIAMHMADDLSAIAMFEELQDKDAGLIINNNSIVINHLWAWKIDPVTKHMYLEWIGETANE